MNYSRNPFFVLGFHGCDESVAERLLTGTQHLKPSRNDYDWLGTGVYFWENDPLRAFEWAEIERNRGAGNPAVVGAVIDLGLCLNLLQRHNLRLLKAAYDFLEDAAARNNTPMPSNLGPNQLIRKLDCSVIEMVHQMRLRESLEPFDSVRGLFEEGSPVFPGAGFRDRNHIQICVRDPRCILGYFRPIELESHVGS